MRSLHALALALVFVSSSCPAFARTARDLSARMRIDGYTSEFVADDEIVFGVDTLRALPQELSDDSKWQNNELDQIHLTWDAHYLYAAVDGKIWGNNVVLFFDTVPDSGLASMASLNSWRRNVTFDTFARFPGDEFRPDVFGATWDTNTDPKLVTYISGNQVDDRAVGSEFRAVASFDQANDGRAMEFAIPWRNVFAKLGGGPGTTDVYVNVGGVGDTLRRLPPGVQSIKVGAFLTAGWDGSGGPDSAPDNLRGHTEDGNENVFLDNYATVWLDLNDDTGLGGGGPDGFPDWNVSPYQRVTFRYPPPIVAARFSLADLWLERPAFKPDQGDAIRFHVSIEPPLDRNDPVDVARRVRFSANLYDASGRTVRNLFIDRSVLAMDADAELNAAGLTAWDGRDEHGRLVEPGIYILRVTIEPNFDRATRALVVVR